MNKFSLYFIRHGETEANKNKILQGQTLNTSLTQKGADDADETGLRLRSINWIRCYSSDLDRALSTANIILRHNDNFNNTSKISDLESSTLLREVNYGIRYVTID